MSNREIKKDIKEYLFIALFVLVSDKLLIKCTCIYEKYHPENPQPGVQTDDNPNYYALIKHSKIKDKNLPKFKHKFFTKYMIQNITKQLKRDKNINNFKTVIKKHYKLEVIEGRLNVTRYART